MWDIYRDSIYDMFYIYKNTCKRIARQKLSKQKLWTFE